MKIIITVLTTVMLSSIQAFACNPYMTVDSPDLDISRFQFVEPSANRGISEDEFNNIMDKFHDVYDPIFQARGGKLVFPDSNWGISSVNGTVRRENDEWRVLVYGGYARHRLATRDAVIFITCHEIGHHLGETAYYGGDYTWAAAEGQADYYSTLKCMRLFTEDEDNEAIMADVKVPEIVVNKCATQYSDKEDQLICQRGTMAGYQMTQIWANGNGTFAFDTPSTKVQKNTIIYHPAHQCRIDTYLQGALCDVDPTIDLSGDDYNVGTCTTKQNHTVGLRPTCWFNEGDFVENEPT